MGSNGSDVSTPEEVRAAAELEAYETELLYVQGNASEDSQRIKDVKAEIAKRTKKRGAKEVEER